MKASIDLLNLYVTSCRNNAKEKRNDQSTTEAVTITHAVDIVRYTPEYQSIFKSLNEEWISTYFEMEEADYKTLNNPQEYILDRGEKIFVAHYKNEAVGVCALIKMDDPNYDFELAKIAVSPKARGNNIGWLLGQKAVSTARELGATRLVKYATVGADGPTGKFFSAQVNPETGEIPW